MWETLYQQWATSLQRWSSNTVDKLPQIALSLVILVAAIYVNGRAQRTVERIVSLRNGQRELGRLLGRITRISLVVITLLIVLSLLGLNTIVAPFIASLGIAGLVIAFALQDITKNFAAGVLLLLLRPFRLDDRIKVRDFEGTVTDISLRATSLRTADGIEVLVPNADVYSSPILNLTRYPLRRYVVPLPLPPTIPVEPARQRLESVLRGMGELEHDPSPEVVVTGATIEAVTLEARYWLPSTAPHANHTLTRVIERLHPVIDQLKADVAISAKAGTPS